MGPRLLGWRLSPLYDVMPRATLASERRLHLGVGPQGRIATLDNAFNGREMFTLSAETAERIAPAFRHIDDLSTRSLRKLIP